MCVRYKVMVKVLVKDNNGFVVGVEYLTVEQLKAMNNQQDLQCERM